MTAQDRWVRADGKRPITEAGCAASSTNSRTWSTYAAVCESKAGDGMGVMLGGGLGCYDLDGCLIDGHLTDEARRIIDAITAPILYTEVSVSGRGLHIFTAEPEGPGAELEWGGHYTRSRFIRTTGNTWR